MKRTKKALGLIATMALVVALTACGGNAKNNAGNAANNAGGAGGGNQPEKQAKISLFQNKVEIAEALEGLAEKYKKETGNEVDVWGSAGDAYMTQLQAKLAAKEGPTIFSVGPARRRKNSSLITTT
ncbi:hypothetical protein HMSSN036_26660 [Paenibacillus macerans]|nr:hypothetical protein HMSSN036_26660 [Paenibacillus macerans]